MESESLSELQSGDKADLYQLLFGRDYSPEEIKDAHNRLPVENIYEKIHLLQEYFPDYLRPDSDGEVLMNILHTNMVIVVDSAKSSYFFIYEDEQDSARYLTS